MTTWLPRRRLPQNYDPDRLRERGVDGLYPPTLTASTLIYDGFIPSWALRWTLRPGKTTSWSTR